MDELGVERLDEMRRRRNEEILKLGKRQLREGLTYEETVLIC